MSTVVQVLITLLLVPFMVWSIVATIMSASKLMNTSDAVASSGIAKRRSKGGFVSSLILLALSLIFFVVGARFALVYLALALGIGCTILSLVLQNKAAAITEESRATRTTRAIEDAKTKSELERIRSQQRTEKVMNRGGEKIVGAKVDTAVATERAKSNSVKAATAAMTVGAIGKPKEAIAYAQESGALAEGKEIADKYADKLMGDMAPTVTDDQYPDVTAHAQAVMSDADSAFVEKIKSMSRDALEEIVRKGAESLMIDVVDRNLEQISQDVISYTPEEYRQSLPTGLTDEEKAAYMIERMNHAEEEEDS